MMKKICLLIIMAMLFVGGSSVYASPFKTVEVMYGNAMFRLKTNGPIRRSYDTPNGKFELMLTYPYQQGKACHVQAWMNNRKVYDYYLSAVDNGYATRIYRDETSDQIFISFSSYQRSILIGYSDKSKEVETFIDSRNYYSGFNWSAPWIYAMDDGSLVLDLCDGYDDVPTKHIHRYQFDWDQYLQWFGYTDLGVLNTGR